jgi:protoporphyrinogen/coproporphyrinogen III oxidase
MTSAAAPRVVVVGGGVTGLAAAYHVLRLVPSARLTLLESSGRLGGCIATEESNGFLIDAGPDSFLRTKPDGISLCRELGIDGEFISTRPEARHVYIAHRGALELMPAGMVLAVPTRVGPMLKTPILSLPAKLRVLGDIGIGLGWRKSDRPIEDESIAAFLTRHFGQEATSRIGGPLLGGLYAGEIDELSIRATFPQLVELEEKHGSVILGLFAQHRKRTAPEGRAGLGELWRWLRRDPELAPSPFVSLRGGMQGLVSALAARLPPDSVHLNEPVTSLTQTGSEARWRVATERQRYDADAVVLTVPANAAARLLSKGRLRDELAQIRYVSTAAVFFALDRTRVQDPLAGSGFIVPPGEGEILAATWISSKWDGRAPEGSVLLRAFIGESRGAPNLESASDAELVAFARAGLERLMGPLGPALFERVFRYVRNRPQPSVGHKARLRRIEGELEFLPGLYVAGAAYDGVGIPDCVRQARAAAERLSQALP